MDCNYARLLLTFTHKKAELDTAEAEALQTHLDQCPECELTARSERAMDEALGRAMNAVAVPAGWRERLNEKLAATQRFRLPPAAGLARAAALLLAVGLGSYIIVLGRPKLDLDDLAMLTSAREEVLIPLAEPEQIEEAFRQQGVSMKAPARLNYGLIKSFEVVQFKKRPVAKLVFAREEAGQVAMAEVYVLSDKDFNLASLRDDLEKGRDLPRGSRLSLQILPPSDGFLFLVILQSGTLEHFLVDAPPSA
jgi:hypothetical protein